MAGAMRFVVLIWTAALGLAAVASLGWAGLGALGTVSARADAVNHLAPFALAAAVAVLLAALTVRRRAGWIVACAVVGAGYQGWRVIPELAAGAVAPGRTPLTGQTAGQAVRIVTFNVQGWQRWDPDRVAAWIVGEAPDLIALQEAEGTATGLVRQLRAAGWRHVSHCPWRPGCNTVILSRTRPQDSSSLGLRIGASAAWAGFVLPDGTRYRLATVHLVWPLDRPLTRWPPPPPRQAVQMEHVAAMARRLGPRDLILVGDFNSTPWAFAIDRMARRAGLVRHSRALWSWPAAPPSGRAIAVPVLPIDHVLAGGNWRVARLVRGPALGPDHYPLSMTLVRIAAPQPGSAPVQPPAGP